MKKPLLYSLLLWLVLLLVPATRGQAWLDWKSATLQQLSDYNQNWVPLDAPFQPEKDVQSGRIYYGYGQVPQNNPLEADEVTVNGLTVTSQFAPLAKSNDRDILVWCARSVDTPTTVARNMEVLSRRFPNDAALLAWACAASMQQLSLNTRSPGPMSYWASNWSVRIKNTGAGVSPSSKNFYNYRVQPHLRPGWEALAAKARRGQKLEPDNALWWWLETTALLGARHDEAVWRTLRAGSTKPRYDDHSYHLVLALKNAHLNTQGAVPASFYLSNASLPWIPSGKWYEAARQICENIMGARLLGHHKAALEGGRDLMRMGRLLRLGGDRNFWVANATENVALQNVLATSSFPTKQLKNGSSAQALSGAPTSLLRYANQQGRSDIALQITNEWNDLAKARKAQMAKLTVVSVSFLSRWQDTDDSLLPLAVGSQNIGTLLVQTLPIPLLALAISSLLLLPARKRLEPFALPTWTRGLGWSAFSVLVLIGAQALFGFLAWQFVNQRLALTLKPFWVLNLILPRLVALLPLWAFAFPACVIGVGAWWATLFAARRSLGEPSLRERLRLLISSPDNRVGVVNLEPIVQIIGLTSLCGLGVVSLGLWFYLPQDGALEQTYANTMHQQFSGLMLVMFCVLATLPAFHFRSGQTGFRTYFFAWLHLTRRYLAAHIALATTLYLLLSISGTYWSARFDAKWLKFNAPHTSSK